MIDINKLLGLTLAYGAHSSPKEGVCLLEAICWIAGESVFSDKPKCVCPVIASFGRQVNDRLDIETRQRLKEVATDMVGTTGSAELQLRRAYRLADWSVRTLAATALDKANLPEHATTLRNLAPIADRATALAADAAANATSRATHAAATNAATNSAAYAAYYAAYYAANAAYAAANTAHYAANAANAAYYAAYAANGAAYAANAAAYASIEDILTIMREVCAMKDEP